MNCESLKISGFLSNFRMSIPCTNIKPLNWSTRHTLSFSGVVRRGFSIGVKRLKPRAPDYGGPQNFDSKDNFQHFCKQLHLHSTYVLVHQRTFFTMSLIKDLSRRISAKDWSEGQWAFPFYGFGFGYYYI